MLRPDLVGVITYTCRVIRLRPCIRRAQPPARARAPPPLIRITNGIRNALQDLVPIYPSLKFSSWSSCSRRNLAAPVYPILVAGRGGAPCRRHRAAASTKPGRREHLAVTPPPPSPPLQRATRLSPPSFCRCSERKSGFRRRKRRELVELTPPARGQGIYCRWWRRKAATQPPMYPGAAGFADVHRVLPSYALALSANDANFSHQG